jgi:hypothetical protein
MTILRSSGAAGRAAILALAALASACGDDDPEVSLLPLTADITIQPVATPSVVFLQKRAVSGDMVFVDIMLRPGGTLTYDAFGFAFRFNPAVLQVGIIGSGDNSALAEPFATPFGNCNAAADLPFCPTPTTSPICADNTDPSSLDDANATGTLILGVAAATGAGCSDATASAETRLLTLALTAATVGESTFEFVSTAPRPGECEILDDLMDLGVPCDAGMAVFRASR